MKEPEKPDLDELIYWFDVNGFVILPQLLLREEVDGLNEILDDRLPDPGRSLESQLFPDFLRWSERFGDLIDRPELMPLLHAVLGQRVRLDRCYGLFMDPGASGVPLHGGAADIDDSAEFYSFDRGRIRNGVVTISWALTPADVESGGFACIPGSHKANIARPEGVTERDAVVLPLQAGDAVVFSSAIAHCGPIWRGPGQRRAIVFKYMPSHLAWSRAYLSWPRDLVDSYQESRKSMFDPPSILQGDQIGIGRR